jgi:hypothetical protein
MYEFMSLVFSFLFCAASLSLVLGRKAQGPKARQEKLPKV